MKILVRINGHEKTTYEWREVNTKEIIKNNRFIYKETGARFDELDILAVKNPVWGKYVYCINCGEVVKNTSEAIEKHYDKREKDANCLTCRNRRDVELANDCSVRYKLNEDGTYKRITTTNVEFRCGGYYSRHTPEEAKRNRSCQYYNCRKNGMTTSATNFFETHKNPFAVLATEKSLLSNGWSLVENYETNRVYKYKNRNLFCTVDRNGIVISFKYKNDVFVYSKTHDEFFGVTYGRINVNPTCFWNASDTWRDNMKEIIRKLYK